MPKQSSRVPVHLVDKCEQNVNRFQSTHIQTPSLEQARGPKVKMTTGSLAWSIFSPSMNSTHLILSAFSFIFFIFMRRS